MDLKVFERHPMFRLATPEDEPEILSSLASSPMHVGGMELVYEREPSFNELLRIQAPEQMTVVAVEQNEIRGFASFSTGERLIDGKPVRASYAGDMRVRTSRILGASLATLLRRSFEFVGKRLRLYDDSERKSSPPIAVWWNESRGEKRIRTSIITPLPMP